MTRVVVTGLGITCPLGRGIPQVWKNLLDLRSGITRVQHFDASAFRTQIGGECLDYKPRQCDPKDPERYDRFILMAMAAAEEAWEESGLDAVRERTEFGVSIGAGFGGIDQIMLNHDLLKEKGPSRMRPFFVPGIIVNMPGGLVAQRWGLMGPNMASVSACSTGNHAIAHAYHTILRGVAPVMVAGGTESALTPLGLGGFSAARALSTRNDDPAGASRPFSKSRDGFVIGDGAGVLILEDLEFARSRHAPIVAEVVGFGESCDAFHPTAPREDGLGARMAMTRALKSAGLRPGDIGLINPHATSTVVGDAVEGRAIRDVFGDGGPHLFATKSQTGHLLGGAGAVEAIFTALALRDQTLPGTLNLEEPEPGLTLSAEARPGRFRFALSNSFGFGGHNTSLVLRKWE
jgi:3-oxoacyl-[acyl-carrier-protein] synthase II